MRRSPLRDRGVPPDLWCAAGPAGNILGEHIMRASFAVSRRFATVALIAATAMLIPGNAHAATTVAGIDISHWNHVNGASINWNTYRSAGYSFVVHKATENSTYTDPTYAADTAGARAAGLVVGAYHFARPALPLSTAVDQANRFLSVTGNLRTSMTLPAVLDLEVTGSLSPTDLAAWTQLWLDTVQQATGRAPIIYTFISFWRTSMANSTAFGAYPLWIASYSGTSAPATTLTWSSWTMWQWTDSGTAAGVPSTGTTDMDYWYGDYASLVAFADGTQAG
jgi:lysozyme